MGKLKYFKCKICKGDQVNVKGLYRSKGRLVFVATWCNNHCDYHGDIYVSISSFLKGDCSNYPESVYQEVYRVLEREGIIKHGDIIFHH